MVGFKTVWTLLILLVFAACVPQTKSTSCKSTEAFSSSLRTCIPIVGTPSSFINITDFLPTSPLVKYKNDFIPVTLEIVFVNPQNAPFTVEWQRVYNGSSVSLIASSNTQTSSKYVFQPSNIGTEIGIHSFQVKIKAANGSVVDSQNFQVTINNTPRPIIKTATIEPADYHVQLTPLAGVMTFEFTTDNNNAAMAGQGYETIWKLTQNGTPQGIVDSDPHFNTAIGTGVPAAQNYSGYDFDPAVWGLGTYVVRAQVTNFANEVVAEQQWTITVAHPALPLAQLQPIYANGTGPSHTATSTAYNGVAYSSSTTNNFIPVGGYTLQGNYCVNFANGNGAYADSDFIRVDYYIDGNQLIYSAFTAALDPQVCLSDAPAGTLSGIVFNNASPNSVQTHEISARAIDMSTGAEYTSANLSPGLSYPFKWTFSVKPVNLPPTVAFSPNATLANITCPSTAGTVKSCNVVQGQTFRVGVTVTDDFYSMLTDQAHFSYSMTLNRGAVPISSCTKLLSDVGATTLPPTDFVGPDFMCDFAVPTYDAAGSINPTTDAWSVTISFADDGSPISGSSSATSTVYTYSLSVTEYSNPAGPTITPQGLTLADSYLSVNWIAPGAHTSAASSTDPLGNSASASYVTEGDTLNFNVTVADPEMDDYKVSIFLCTDFTAACATSTPIVSQTTVLKTDNAPTQTTSYSYLIPENLVPITSALNANVDVFFKVVVADFPDFLTGVAVESIMSTNVRNKNPAPVVDVATQLPLLTGPHNVSVGYPFSINPGNVTDASMNAAENNPTYQWYVSPDNVTFTAISGATSRILFWTPTSNYGATAYLKMCASDGTTIHPVSANFGAVCTGTRASSTYQMAIKSNITTPLHIGYDPAGPTTYQNDPSTGAVWHDTSAGNENVAYLATVDTGSGDYYINVSKLVRETSGVNAGRWNNTFENVRFKALQSVTAALPTDLSIAGTADSLYIAYKCAPSSFPANAKACIRRIEKGFVATTNEKTNLIHKGKFGFAYSGLSIVNTVGNVTYSAPVLGASYTVSFSGIPMTSSPGNATSLTINGLQISADGDGSGTVDANEFCGSTVASCSDTAAASRLRDVINQSTDARLQGVTATLATPTSVSIHGVKSLDSLDSVATVSGVGKISILSGTSFHLPIINKSGAGADENKISVIYGTTDAHMSAAAVNINHILTVIDPALSLATDIDDNGNMVVAIVSALPSRAGQGRLYKVPVSGSTYSGPVTALSTSLFGGFGISNIRLAASRGANAFNYVAAQDNNTGIWKIGRYDENTLALSNTTYQALQDLAASVGTGTSDVVVTGEVQDVQVIADPIINGEARLAITNFGSTVTDGFYLLRWQATNVLSCPGDVIAGACVPFSTFTTDVNSRVFLSAPQSNITIGDAGYTAGENTTNLVHALVFTGAPVSARHMVMNIVPESIHGDDTTLPAGTSGWQPPYVK